jgi:hypothetical protein
MFDWIYQVPPKVWWSIGLGLVFFTALILID